MAQNVVVVGTQWGDEGKGKIVDWLTESVDGVVRFQGGHNAGHTLVIGGRKTILRLIFARQTMAWPYTAPPGIPAERVAVLRAAFMATMRDPEFLADASRAKLEINPVSGQDIEQLVHEIYRTPAQLAQKVAGMLK